MAATLLLDVAAWDLVLNADNDIGVAQPPYALAQDAASACRTFLGEEFWDTTQGVPYLQQIFGQPTVLSIVKEDLVTAALTVPDVASAQVFLTSFTNRVLMGQVQTISASTGQLSSANFSVSNPQGGG